MSLADDPIKDSRRNSVLIIRIHIYKVIGPVHEDHMRRFRSRLQALLLILRCVDENRNGGSILQNTVCHQFINHQLSCFHTASAAVFTANPQIKTWLVTGANEEGTIGACRALETQGLDADACVVGLGAYMAKDEWNDKGAEGTCMKAAAYFSTLQVGEGSVNVLMQLINGEEPALETAVDAIVVTPEDYKEVMGKDAE